MNISPSLKRSAIIGLLISILALATGKYALYVFDNGAGNWGGGNGFAALLFIIIIPPVASAFYLIVSALLSKTEKIKKASIAFFVSLAVAYISIFFSLSIYSTFHQMQIRKNLEDSRKSQIEFYKEQSIAEEQILQDELPLLDPKRPLTLKNSIDGNNKITLNEPFEIQTFIRKEFIPENGKLKAKITSNTFPKTDYASGFLEKTGIQSDDGREIFKGSLTINNPSLSNESKYGVILKVEGKNGIFDLINLKISEQNSQN